MKKLFLILSLILISSCGNNKNQPGTRIISVSIAPFKYFVKEIAGTVFEVNVMVPPGSNPHIYEPFPDQVRKLKESEAYISDGFLGFELTWLDRFYEMNRDMKRLSLSDFIDPVSAGHNESTGETETADPHFWVSPKCAFGMALAIRDFLTGLAPDHRAQFEQNYNLLKKKIGVADSLAGRITASCGAKAFIIYHPNLAYLARDYGLEEIPVEFEGKEPSPSRMIYIINRAKKDNLKTVMIQKEYDVKFAKEIAEEIGGRAVIIDPLSEDWYSSTVRIISILKDGTDKE
jgi:zinc transport system substrate-binding protein